MLGPTIGANAKREELSWVIPSSGNVFADLGYQRGRETDEGSTRVAINQIIQGRKLPQWRRARRLNVNQPKVSALSNYQLDGFFRRTTNEFFSPPWIVTWIS